MNGPKRTPEELAADLQQRLGFAKRLKQARERKGLSQHKLAMQLGLTAGAVGQWEIGANSCQMTTLNKIADILGVTSDWLRKGESGDERDAAKNSGERRTLEVMRSIKAQNADNVVMAIEILEAIDQGQPHGMADFAQDDQEREVIAIVRQMRAENKDMAVNVLRQIGNSALTSEPLVVVAAPKQGTVSKRNKTPAVSRATVKEGVKR